MDEAGIKFLDKLYGNLYMSDVVQHTKENSDNRVEAIRKYLERLEKLHKLATTEARKEHVLKLYYDKYVIKEENIPNYIDKKQVIDAQKKRLSMWINYLTDPNSSYPMWAKYWAFQGMLKMGSYDELNGVYLKRNKKTIAPFIEPNPEILAKSIDTIIKLVNSESIDEITEERLSKTDSFSKIYTTFEKQFKKNVKEKSDNLNGVWVKYNQGSKKDAIKLSKSLENKNTGWCTASESMAISQICGPYSGARKGGDFYVFYTKDKKGKYTIPRIAIRCSGQNEIGEIRGTDESQNLEEGLETILLEKLKSMPFLNQKSVNKNIKIVENLRELYEIGQKTKNNIKLTKRETINLYRKKYGFGWENDPKVDRIRSERTQNKETLLADFNNVDDNIKIYLMSEYLLPDDFRISDKELISKAVQEHSRNFQYASDEIKNDTEFVLGLVKEHNNILSYISDNVKNYKQIYGEIIKKDTEAIKYAPKELINNDSFIIEMLKINKGIYDELPYKVRDKKDIILAAEYFTESFRDKIKSMYVNDKNEMKSNTLKLIKEYPWNLRYASPEMKNDKEVVLTAVELDPEVFTFASEELRNDKEMVLFAINRIGYDGFHNTPFHIDEISEELKKDEEVMLSAIRKYPKALSYVSDELLDNRDFVLDAVKAEPTAVAYLPKKFKNDEEIVLAAVQRFDYNVRVNFIYDNSLSPTLLSNKDFAKKIVEWDYRNISLLPYSLQYDPDIRSIWAKENTNHIDETGKLRGW